MFPTATPEALLSTSRLGHRRLISWLVVGVVLVSGILVGLAFVLSSAPPPPCTTLSCFTVPSAPIEQGVPYVSTKYGWKTRLFPPAGLDARAKRSDSQVEVEFSDPSGAGNLADGTLWIAGAPARGSSNAALVGSVASSYVPEATLDYQIPGASIGYQPGVGEAFEATPNSAFGDSQTYEVEVICSTRNNFAICALASGVRTDLNQADQHPTLAKQVIATYADPDLNGVLWPGESFP